MTPERELWARAQELIRQHGRRAIVHSTRRMVELGDAGDMEGAERWSLIQTRIVQRVRRPTDKTRWQ